VKSERAWAGIICGFFLFIVVCLSLLLHMKGAFRATGHPELGCSSFCSRCGGQLLSPGQRVLRPLIGAMLAAPVCLVVMRLFFVTERSFWQELAWLFSAVFWCALGALCFCLSAPGLIPDAGIRQRNEPSQANRPRFSFAQASKSVQPPMCF
jgi:hypothetical protein